MTAAIITASVSLLVALVSVASSHVNSKRLKELERDTAKIDYEFEARKRLYTVCEPLLFQAMEQAEDARKRICSLARSASQGQLRADGSGWLGPGEIQKYYFESTVYTLLAPITTFSILQRRLTTIDLTVDTKVRKQYEMLKLVFFSFSKDWDLAAGNKAGFPLPYDRNKTDPGERGRRKLLRREPERYAPQGLYRGMLYLTAEALVPSGRGSIEDVDHLRERCMTFGEFQREWDRARSELRLRPRRSRPGKSPVRSAMPTIFESMVELFCGFHPKRKPVLWRVLMIQYLLYTAFLNGQLESVRLTDEEIQSLDWRTKGEAEADFREPILVGEAFVEEELASLRRRLRPVVPSK